jgi:hypothetical protein
MSPVTGQLSSVLKAYLLNIVKTILCVIENASYVLAVGAGV